MTNTTAYARHYGYTGKKPVLVYDGRVVSHRNQDWFEFMHKVRTRTHDAPRYPEWSPARSPKV